jgi:FixJ family two-component response regulator
MATVFIIDDDDSVRRSLGRLLRAEDLHAETFSSAADYLARERFDGIGCLVLDVNMPGMSGIELQMRLYERGDRLPVVFLTGHGDIPMSVQAMKRGAMDFLTKPVDAEDLLTSIRHAIDHHRRFHQQSCLRASVEQRIALLTPREHEILRELLTGAPNKIIADRLGIALKTVKVHRAHVMEKMRVRSIAELVHLCHLVSDNPDIRLD